VPSNERNMSHPKEAKIAALLHDMMQGHDIPGIAVVVFDSERSVIEQAMGVCRLGGEASVTLNSRFHVGSNTKAMTATAIASLVEDDELSWETKLIAVFPELAQVIHKSFKRITLRQLLTHTAGIQPFTDGSEYDALPEFSGTPQEQRYQFTRHLLASKPFSTPGEGHEYSNAGYSIAASMGERVAGMSWQQLMKVRLFDRLETEVFFGWTALSDPEQPWGHMYEGDLELSFEESRSRDSRALIAHPPTDSYYLTSLGAPAGDVSLSIVDFAKFAQVHLRGLRGMETILESETIRFMHEDIQGYALGWNINKAGEVTVSFHNGSAGTFFSQAVLFPFRDYGFVSACNAGHPLAWEGCAKLAQALFDEFKDGSLHVQEPKKSSDDQQ